MMTLTTILFRKELFGLTKQKMTKSSCFIKRYKNDQVILQANDDDFISGWS